MFDIRVGRPLTDVDKNRPSSLEPKSPLSSVTNSMVSAGHPKQRSSFLATIFKKDKRPDTSPASGPETSSPTLISSSVQVSKRKKALKELKRKNISDGRALMSVNSADLVPSDYIIDYKDSPFDIFEKDVMKTSSYVESKTIILINMFIIGFSRLKGWEILLCIQ